MSSDYREGYQVGLKDGKRLGVEEYKKELADSLKTAMPQPLMVVNDIPTLRDQFAIGALSGLVQVIGLHEDVIAETAYSIADEMLKARQADYSSMLEERNKRG